MCAKARQAAGDFVCTGCGTALVEQGTIYCSNCIASWQLEFQKKTQEYQDRVDEMQAKLLLKGSMEAGLMEALRQKELIISELQHKLNFLTQSTGDI